MKSAHRVSKSGKTYIAKAPKKSKDKPSEAQLTQRERFILAGAYAKAAKDEPVYMEMAAQTDRSAYRIAFSDWCNLPVIHRVTRWPGRIRIYAEDDVRVVKVRVAIWDDDGNLLEQGNAIQVETGCWEYKTEVLGKVLVEAFDLAGNVARQEA